MVFGGMLSSTLLAIPFVPVFYVIMQGLSERRNREESSPEATAGTSPFQGEKVKGPSSGSTA